MFTDNLRAHASAAVEMQQVVGSDKITLDLQVSSEERHPSERTFCQDQQEKDK